MCGDLSDRLLRGKVMPLENAVVAGGDQRGSFGDEADAGGIAIVPRQQLSFARSDIDLIDAAVHAGGVEVGGIGGAIEAEHRRRKLKRFDLLGLGHARISLIAGSLSSTRWNVGRLGRSYSA